MFSSVFHCWEVTYLLGGFSRKRLKVLSGDWRSTGEDDEYYGRKRKRPEYDKEADVYGRVDERDSNDFGKGESCDVGGDGETNEENESDGDEGDSDWEDSGDSEDSGDWEDGSGGEDSNEEDGDDEDDEEDDEYDDDDEDDEDEEEEDDDEVEEEEEEVCRSEEGSGSEEFGRREEESDGYYDVVSEEESEMQQSILRDSSGTNELTPLHSPLDSSTSLPPESEQSVSNIIQDTPCSTSPSTGGNNPLAEQVSSGSLECVVCLESIPPASAIWSCKYCHYPLHLPCATSWAESVLKNQDAEGQWPCPRCRHAYRDIPLVYRCWCGRQELRPLWEPPSPAKAHGCYEVCGRLGEGRTAPCPYLCHPGPCPLDK